MTQNLKGVEGALAAARAVDPQVTENGKKQSLEKTLKEAAKPQGSSTAKGAEETAKLQEGSLAKGLAPKPKQSSLVAGGQLNVREESVNKKAGRDQGLGVNSDFLT